MNWCVNILLLLFIPFYYLFGYVVALLWSDFLIVYWIAFVIFFIAMTIAGLKNKNGNFLNKLAVFPAFISLSEILYLFEYFFFHESSKISNLIYYPLFSVNDIGVYFVDFIFIMLFIIDLASAIKYAGKNEK